MTQQQHPITPPPELIEDWIEIAKPEPWKRPPDPNVLCTLAAQWGADQELEACCEWIAAYPWLDHPELLIKQLRAARRPNPPSLKEQALDALAHIATGPNPTAFLDCQDIIRRALEQLDD
jgi:hypothetical protein